MDFEFNNVKYYVHSYKNVNYVYYKDGDLVFIDYNSKTLFETIALFTKIKTLEI